MSRQIHIVFSLTSLFILKVIYTHLQITLWQFQCLNISFIWLAVNCFNGWRITVQRQIDWQIIVCARQHLLVCEAWTIFDLALIVFLQILGLTAVSYFLSQKCYLVISHLQLGIIFFRRIVINNLRTCCLVHFFSSKCFSKTLINPLSTRSPPVLHLTLPST